MGDERAELRRLVAAAASRRAPREQRERVRAAIAARVAGIATLTASSAAGASAVASTAATAGAGSGASVSTAPAGAAVSAVAQWGAWKLGALGVASAVALSTGAALVAYQHLRAPAAIDAAPAAAASSAPRLRAPVRPAPGSERAELPPVPSASARPALVTRPSASVRPPDIERELALLRSAQLELDRNDGQRALVLLDRYLREFPNGQLRAEHDAARALALCAAGRSEAGRREAERFTRSDPRSALSRRVRAACGPQK